MPIRAQRIQGLVFSATAVAGAASAELVQRLDPQTELVAMAILIVILGVPHGVLDTVFARNLYNVRTAKEWVGFTVVYFILAALVVAFWQFAPQLFLAGFLMISIVHFSGDPSPGTPVLSRIFYGGAIIVLPTILYAPKVTQLFAFLVSPDAAMQTVAALLYLKWPWLVGLVLAAIDRMQSDWLSSIEIAALGLLATLAPPLVAFTVFFCFMHSARHILRTMDYFDQISLPRMVFAAATPMGGTVILSVVAWNSFGNAAIDVRVSQLLFVGLAALTVPHMAIVERVRLSGWIRK